MTGSRIRRSWRLVQVCAISRRERIVRGAIAVIAAAAAVSAFGTGTWALGVAASVAAVVLTVLTVTGWCPSLPSLRPAPSSENELGIPEARQRIEID